MSTNNGKHNSILPEAVGVELSEFTSNEGKLYCKFTRKAKTTIQGTTYDLLNDKYYLLLAQGPVGKFPFYRRSILYREKMVLDYDYIYTKLLGTCYTRTLEISSLNIPAVSNFTYLSSL